MPVWCRGAKTSRAELPQDSLSLVWAFDVDHAPPGFSRGFHQRALERGLFLRPIGGAVYFMPPYVIEEPEMALMARVTLELLDQS